MHIEDKRTQANDTFGKLRDGECFTIVEDYEEIVCMKVCVFDENDHAVPKVINLGNGIEIAVVFEDDTLVQKVNARVTIW